MIDRPPGSLAPLLLLLLLLGVGAWLAWPRVAAELVVEDTAGRELSPALAEATLDRFERFRAGGTGPQLALGDAELTSVLRYALPGVLPPGVTEPDVRIAGSRVTLSARVTTAAFPDLPALDPVIGMLPDTVPVRMDGGLAQFGKQSLAFRVAGLEVAAIPLPDRLVPPVLYALGRTDQGGLPKNTLHVPLPAGIDSVYVARDSLVLVGDR